MTSVPCGSLDATLSARFVFCFSFCCTGVSSIAVAGVDADVEVVAVVDFERFVLSSFAVLSSFVVLSGFAALSSFADFAAPLVFALAFAVVFAVFSVFAADALACDAGTFFAVVVVAFCVFPLAAGGDVCAAFVFVAGWVVVSGLPDTGLVAVCGEGAAAFGAVVVCVDFGALPCPCAVTTMPPARNSTETPKKNRVRNMFVPLQDRSLDEQRGASCIPLDDRR